MSIPADLPLPPPDPDAPDPYQARDAAILDRMLAAQASEARRHTVATTTLAELALLPEFTPRLLAETRILSPVPEGGDDLLADESLFERRHRVAGPRGPELVLWVRPEVRADVGSRIRTEMGLDGPRQLLRSLRDRLRGTELAAGRGFRTWLRVADLIIADPGGRRALEALDDAGLREAGTMVELLGAMSDILGGTLPSVTYRARSLIAAKVRAAETLRMLEDYQHRNDLEHELARRLRERGTRILHLKGDGGVGKTMLLRYAATAEFAAAHRLPGLLFASVDFDHLDPRYPLLRPLLLLEAMETQLVFPAEVPTASVDRARDRFLDAVDGANETAKATGSTPSDPVAVGTEAFAELVSLTDRQAVLVLDTAEQLAKEDLGGDISPLDATLTLLGRLHDALARLDARPVSVIFAGRRPLLSRDSNHRWGEVQEIPVPGFDQREAVGYLVDRIGRSDDGLLEASRVRFAKSGAEPRYNPFELAIWSGWLLDEERQGRTLDLEALGEYVDPYVQRRILARVTEPILRPLVAPAIMLGRFDVALLAPTSERARIDHRRAVRTLADQEWVRVVKRDVDGRAQELEVDEHLQGRLRRALAVSQFPLDRRRLVEDLRTAIGERPLAEQGVDAFAGLVRLLDPEPALLFWRELEERIAREDAWDWADGLLVRLEPVVGPESRLRPALTATRAVISSRRPGGADIAASLWRSVIAGTVGADADAPDAELVSRGVLALATRSLSPSTDTVRKAPIGAVVGAVSAALELGQKSWGDVRETEWFAAALDRLREHRSLVAHAVAGLADVRNGADGRDLLELARVLARVRGSEGPLKAAADWTDWAPPEGLAERCALAAFISPASRLDHDDADLASLVEAARADRLHDIDAERLCAAYLWRRVQAGSTDRDELLEYELSERSAYTPDRQPACRLHLGLPRLVEVIAVGWALDSQPALAETLLRTRLEQAVRTAGDADAVADAQLALARIFRLYRIGPATWSLGLASPAAELEMQVTARLLGLPEERVATRSVGKVEPARPRRGRAEDTLGRAWGRLRELELAALDEPLGAADELLALAGQTRPTSPVLADMAWTLGVLARARAGAPVAAETRSWKPGSEAFREPEHLVGGWGESWSHRFNVARIVAGDPPEMVPETLRWLTGGQRSPELAIGALIEDAREVVVEPVSAPTGLSRRRTRSTVRFAPSTALWAGIAAIALLYGALAAWLAATYSGVSSIFPMVIGAALAAVLFVGFGAMLARAGNPRRLFGRYFTVTVEPGPSGRSEVELSSGTPPYRLLSREAPGRRLVKAMFGGNRRSLRSAALVLGDAGLERARVEPADWRLPRWPLGTVRIEVDVPASVSAEPWEHWLAEAAGRPEDYYVWVRPYPGWPDGMPAPGAPRYAGPDYLANREVESLPPELGTSASKTGTHLPYLPHARLVHVVGVPVLTSAGWRLRVDEDHVGDSEGTVGAPWSTRRENLVVPVEIARLAAVVVVQGAPSLSAAEPFDVDREGIMTFALDTLDAGAAAVLVVPPLGEAIAGSVVDLTTTWAKKERRAQPVDVLALLADLATLVHEAARREDLVTWHRAQDDVVGFVRFVDDDL